MVLLGWILCLSGLVACLYAGFDLVSNKLDDKVANGLYLGFNRQGWSLALCGMILLCVSGYGGPINAFLSLPVFQFLTKISYSMYLIHYAVIILRYSSMRTPFRFSNLQTVSKNLIDIIYTTCFADAYFLGRFYDSCVFIYNTLFDI